MTYEKEPKNLGIDPRLFDNVIHINETCPYHIHLDLHITALDKGISYLESELKQYHMNPMEIVHGGMVFSLGDTAMGMAIRTTNHDVVTIDSQCYFMRTARKGAILRGIGEVVKVGKTIIVAKAQILDDNDTVLALLSGTFFNRGQVLDLS